MASRISASVATRNLPHLQANRQKTTGLVSPQQEETTAPATNPKPHMHMGKDANTTTNNAAPTSECSTYVAPVSRGGRRRMMRLRQRGHS